MVLHHAFEEFCWIIAVRNTFIMVAQTEILAVTMHMHKFPITTILQQSNKRLKQLENKSRKLSKSIRTIGKKDKHAGTK